MTKRKDELERQLGDMMQPSRYDSLCLYMYFRLSSCPVMIVICNV